MTTPVLLFTVTSVPADSPEATNARDDHDCFLHTIDGTTAVPAEAELCVLPHRSEPGRLCLGTITRSDSGARCHRCGGCAAGLVYSLRPALPIEDPRG